MNQPDINNFILAKKYLSENQKAYIDDLEILLKITKTNHISDYSFLVAPAAKVYEGFLNDFFFKIGIIDENEHESDRFRVGKTLNPSLRYKRFSVYKRLADYHEQGEELAEILWNAWKLGRNEILHYFPNNLKKISRTEAEDLIDLILRAVIKAGEFTNETV